MRQLGLAYLVYPGATHSRFEHALGAYHLARRTLALLRGARRARSDSLRTNAPSSRAAALLHDIGHYPFSHALEEIGVLHHEEVARPLITEGEVADGAARATSATTRRERIIALIRGASDEPAPGADLRLARPRQDRVSQARRAHVRRAVRRDRRRPADPLAHGRRRSGHAARRRSGSSRRDSSALESLLFAKYQMYRNVYWHHAVRSATAMYKRLVDDALRSGALEERELARLHRRRLAASSSRSARPRRCSTALRERRLYKRAFELPRCGASDASAATGSPTTARACSRRRTQLARELGLAPGEVLLDYPVKTQMLGLDIPVRMRGGEVRRFGAKGWPAAINLPLLSQELYESTRVMRVFATEGTKVPRPRVMELLAS